MEKVIKSWKKDYRYVKLYKNDVEDIIKIVQTELSKNAHIVIDEFILEEVHELDEIDKETVNKLYISCGGVIFVMNLDTNIASLEIANKEDYKLRGVASKIDDILSVKQGLLSLIFLGPQSWILRIILLLVTGGFLSSAITTKAPINLLIFIVVLIASVLSIYCTDVLYNYRTTIHMCYPSEKQNFFKRKKDDILVGVIISIVSLILGVCGTLIYQRINKASQQQPSNTESELTNNQDVNDTK